MIKTACFTLLLSALLILGAAHMATATVAMAESEQKPCSYCHVSASPGRADALSGQTESAALNEAGSYYASHNYSLKGYVEKGVNALSSLNPNTPPPFKTGWYMELPGQAERIAVANLGPNGGVRLVTLEPGTDKGTSTLSILNWGDGKFSVEQTASVQGDAGMLQVGYFAGADGPLLIVTQDGLRYMKKGKLAFQAAPHPLALIGALELKDGQQRLLVKDPALGVRTYRVDLSAVGSGWLADRGIPPDNSACVWVEIHSLASLAKNSADAAAAEETPVVGEWIIPTQRWLYVYETHLSKDMDRVVDPATQKATIVVKREAWQAEMVYPYVPGGLKFFTPELSGRVWDIARQSPKPEEGPGMLVLTDFDNGKSRALYFFPLIQKSK